MLILDEPASHLPHREALQALSAVMDAEIDRGVLLVTHRREKVALAGRELELGAGRALAGERAGRSIRGTAGGGALPEQGDAR